MHELCWDKTNPEWKKLDKKKLIKAIMNQRANASADLAKVLFIQQKARRNKVLENRRLKTEQEGFLTNKWASVRAKAELAQGDKFAVLEKEVRDLRTQIGYAKSQDKPQEAQALTDKWRRHSRELQSISWAASMVGKTTRVIPEKIPKKIRKRLLPARLKETSKPFNLQGLEIHWADPYDAESAAQWPKGIITAETLDYVKQQRQRGLLTKAAWEAVSAEMERTQMAEEESPRPKTKKTQTKRETDTQTKTGVWKYIPEFLSNRFERSSVRV